MFSKSFRKLERKEEKGEIIFFRINGNYKFLVFGSMIDFKYIFRMF